MLIHFFLPKRTTSLQRRNRAVSKCPLVRGSTVCLSNVSCGNVPLYIRTTCLQRPLIPSLPILYRTFPTSPHSKLGSLMKYHLLYRISTNAFQKLYAVVLAQQDQLDLSETGLAQPEVMKVVRSHYSDHTTAITLQRSL